jgi:hypothetical protein
VHICDEVQRVLDEIQHGAENGKAGIHWREFLMAELEPESTLAVLYIKNKSCYQNQQSAGSIQNEAHLCEI